MKTLLKVIGVFLSSLIVASTLGGMGFAGTPKRGGDLTIFTVNVTKINSAFMSGGHSGMMGSQLFAGLVLLDDKFITVPYLAKSWDISKDGLTYTFHLVEGATFHDGKPITSEDVAFSFDIVKENHPYGPITLGPVDRVETPDQHTAVFKLTESHPAFLPALSTALFPILPKHIFSGHPIREHPANKAPIGSGPFKFVERKEGEYLIMERYDKFFRPGRPYLDRLIWKVIKDPSVLIMALKRNEVQYAPFASVRVRDIGRVKTFKNVAVTRRGYEGIAVSTYLEFNHRKKPFDDKRVRQAISYAIDREFITKTLHLGYSKPGTGPIAHGTPFYYADVKTYGSAPGKHDANLEKANKLMDEAGYPRKADGMRFSCTLMWYPAAPDSQITLAEYLKPQLRKVGIDVKLLPSPDWPTWIKRVANWDHELTMNAIYTNVDPVIGVHRLYLCSNRKKGRIWTNTMGYCNPKVDEILSKATTELDFKKRKKLYDEFQKIVAEELPVAWTHELPYFTIYNKNLRNLPLSVWGCMAPYDAMYWEKKPQ